MAKREKFSIWGGEPSTKGECYDFFQERKKLCKSRKFGIGQEIIFPNLTDLQVVNLEEPYYYMNVDGDRLYLDSAKHLTNQTMFQEECVKQ